MKYSKNVGKTINGLEVIGTTKIETHTYYIVRCVECGDISEKRGDTVSNGQAKCGCKYKDKLHGKSRSKIYWAWGSMKSRCSNPNDPNYKNYGGRGITISDEWGNSFQSFCDWSINNGYTEELTLDRIDVNGNYEPSNCRWVDMKTQCNNRRSNRLITYNGETLTMSQWADKLGINKMTLKSRLNISNWSIEKAFNTPVRKCERR